MQVGKTARNKLIGAVHAAANKAGLAEDARRDIQRRAAGKDSCADMSIGELGKVLDEINKITGHAGRPPVQGKIRALWLSLYYLGVVRNPADAALDGFVKRQTGVERLKWLGPQQASRVIEALKSMAVREGGVDWDIFTGQPPVGGDRVAVAFAIWERLKEAGLVQAPALFGVSGYGSALGNPETLRAYEPTHWDKLIRALGKKLLAHRAAEEGGDG